MEGVKEVDLLELALIRRCGLIRVNQIIEMSKKGTMKTVQSLLIKSGHIGMFYSIFFL